MHWSVGLYKSLLSGSEKNLYLFENIWNASAIGQQVLWSDYGCAVRSVMICVFRRYSFWHNLLTPWLLKTSNPFNRETTSPPPPPPPPPPHPRTPTKGVSILQHLIQSPHCLHLYRDFYESASWPGVIINPQWLELLISQTFFYGPKGVRAKFDCNN